MKHKLEQKCGGCLYLKKCYAERASPRNIVINILACRIRQGINRNESSRLLLEMIRPNLIKLITTARNKVGDHYIDAHNLLADLESRVIESLISEDGYRIGEPAYLTEYLFGTNPKTGWLKKWILWGFSKNQRFHKRHILIGAGLKSDMEEDEQDDNNLMGPVNDNLYHSYEPEESNEDAIQMMMNIINDGITLNANEYRVISFCMSHANESNKSRLIDGTHTYLSSIMGVSRPRITRLFSVSRVKILRAAQDRNISFN
jgi:hypothetical protein